MVVIPVEVDKEKMSLYMDGTLHKQLIENVRPSVRKKDFDYVFVVDGSEGGGKSVMAFQIAKILDPDLTLDNIAFTPQDFIKAIKRAKPYTCIVFDESFTGLSSRSSLSEMNRIIVSLMMEMRQKNLFVILVMPTFFMLDKYAVMHRAKGLFHVYIRKGKRGYWNFYNQQKMKMLWLKGKKYFEYHMVKPRIFGRFRDQYTINEQNYREKKMKSLTAKRRNTRAEVYKEQRDTLFFVMVKGLKMNMAEVSRACKKWGYSIDRSTISDIIAQKNKELVNHDDSLEKNAPIPPIL